MVQMLRRWGEDFYYTFRRQMAEGPGRRLRVGLKKITIRLGGSLAWL
jgi:hypothetical protein